jgi:parallel beta-helix repeat protein
VGDAEYSIPAGALFVSSSQGSDSNPGTQAQPLRTVLAAVRAASSGQTIVLRAGTYHENIFVTDGKRLTIQNYPDEAVWFDGSIPVTNWTRQGSTWVSTGWTAHFDHSASFTFGSDAGGFVNQTYPMAAWPDQMFVDGDPIAQVGAGVTPGAGQFAVDYQAQTLTIGSDPTGHSIRASDLQQAFVVAGTVTLRGFGVRRYATSLPQIGTIFFGGTHGGNDVVQNVVIYDNATQGLGIGVPNCVIDHVTTNRNGMTGMMANQADNLTIQNSVLDRNNTEHFNSSPSAGGMKIGRTNGVVIRNNEVEDNLGINGIWTDISVSNFKIVGNTVTGNAGPYGIITELSDTGIVADNTISGAKYGYTAFDTGNVKVYNNTLSNNTVWDIGASQDERRNTDPATKASIPWLVRNITVSNNLYGSAGSFQFYALDKATHIAASTMNITVDGNAFPGNTHAVMVGWGGSDNSTVTYYRSPSALDAGLHVSWTNVLLDAGSSDLKGFANSSADDVAVPLPADVASAIGVPAGTKHIGTF